MAQYLHQLHLVQLLFLAASHVYSHFDHAEIYSYLKYDIKFYISFINNQI